MGVAVAVNISTITTTTVVAGVTGKSIRVVAYSLTLAGTTTPSYRFLDDTQTLSGNMEASATLADRGGLLETAVGAPLQIATLGATNSTQGFLVYELF